MKFYFSNTGFSLGFSLYQLQETRTQPTSHVLHFLSLVIYSHATACDCMWANRLVYHGHLPLLSIGMSSFSAFMAWWYVFLLTLCLDPTHDLLDFHYFPKAKLPILTTLMSPSLLTSWMAPTITFGLLIWNYGSVAKITWITLLPGPIIIIVKIAILHLRLHSLMTFECLSRWILCKIVAESLI